jgi:hypothetical protein
MQTPSRSRGACTLPATAYPALDTFGRTRRILWKDGRFAPRSCQFDNPLPRLERRDDRRHPALKRAVQRVASAVPDPHPQAPT